MADFSGFFITWTTYGTWLPGDERGWSKRGKAKQESQPALEHWCKQNQVSGTVVLGKSDRLTVEDAIREHCQVRNWGLPAVNARSNHVHVVVQAYEKATIVRDQLKANCTRKLRIQLQPLIVTRTWTKGGDCEVLKDDEALEAAVRYVLEAQDEPSRFDSQHSRRR